MAIKTTTDGDYISFGALPQITNLQKKSLLAWIKIDVDNTNSRRFVFQYGTGSNELYTLRTTKIGGVLHVGFEQNWSGGGGAWYGDGILSVGSLYLLAATYDSGSSSNDPVLYLNGAPQTVTEAAAPSGSLNAGTTTELRLNSLFPGNTNVATTTQLIAPIYNRILSASEILEAYYSRLARPSLRGLVFDPLLVGAKNVQTFEGAVLAAGNIVTDQINGARGTPNGSMVGLGDAWLTFQGMT